DLARQERLYPQPLRLGKFIALHAHPSSSAKAETYESRISINVNPECGLDLVDDVVTAAVVRADPHKAALDATVGQVDRALGERAAVRPATVLDDPEAHAVAAVDPDRLA